MERAQGGGGGAAGEGYALSQTEGSGRSSQSVTDDADL